MHIFEACLAWKDAGPLDGDGGWNTLGDEIAELCLSRFLHPGTGALREFFDGEWGAMAGEQGRIIEPGHQFEWAWLLKRWGVLRHRDDAIAAGERLVDIAEKNGVDRQRGVAFNELWDDFSIKDSDARLWPQTERLKAWLAMADIAETEAKRQAALITAAVAARGLMKYFSSEVPGLWHETMRFNGSFAPAEARASSLYHVMCGFEQLKEAVDKYT
jgi:mannose-6-phosphate isomerase